MTRIQSGTWLVSALLGCILLTVVTPGSAGETDGGEESHEKARALQKAGDIRSLEEVLRRIREEHGGRVLEAELDQENGHYVYEVEILDKEGRVDKLFYDARSGEAVRKGR